MNILLSFSSSGGGSYLTFNTDSLNLELQHHKDIMNAINFHREEMKKEMGDRTLRKKFGENIETIWGEITDSEGFISCLLHGECQFSDEESEYYNPNYIDITIKPPFYIDEVITVRTFD